MVSSLRGQMGQEGASVTPGTVIEVMAATSTALCMDNAYKALQA